MLACAATPGGGDAGDARADAEEESPTPWNTCEPDAGGVVVNVIMHLPWTGATTTGVGMGASWACFEEAFGLPDYPWAVHEGEADIYDYAEWSDARVWAEDNDNNGLGAESDPGEADGYVDLLRIWGE